MSFFNYDNWKAHNPDDEMAAEFPLCNFIPTDDGGAYCKFCGARGDDRCPWEDRS